MLIYTPQTNKMSGKKECRCTLANYCNPPKIVAAFPSKNLIVKLLHKIKSFKDAVITHCAVYFYVPTFHC